MIDLTATADLSRLLGDPSRLRLLALLQREELTVAELTGATRLAQSRVSTHLGRLREAGLLRLRKAGTSTFYALDDAGMPAEALRLLGVLTETTSDAMLEDDAERLATVVAARGGTWADSVAGQMERHYSPGRTWEAAARGLIGLASLGHVLDVASGDGALAELVAPRSRSVTCVDVSPRVVAAGRRRLSHLPVRLLVADMHDLPFGGERFDQVLLVNSLSYARDPGRVVHEVARVLRPGGELVATTLQRHGHEAVARNYNHARLGFLPDELSALFAPAGFDVESCGVTSRERRAPHFEIVTLCARRQGGRADGPTPSRHHPAESRP